MVLRNRAFILHADPLPFVISSKLFFGGKGFENRSVRFRSGRLFCKHRYHTTLKTYIPTYLSLHRNAYFRRQRFPLSGIANNQDYVYIYIYIYIYIHIHKYIYIYIYTRIYTFAYIYIYTHTYTTIQHNDVCLRAKQIYDRLHLATKNLRDIYITNVIIIHNTLMSFTSSYYCYYRYHYYYHYYHLLVVLLLLVDTM